MSAVDPNAPLALPHACELMHIHVADPRFPVEYEARWREYVLAVHDSTHGGELLQQILFCPWCGTRLPESLHQTWCDELDALLPGGYDLSVPGEAIPAHYRTDAWWRERGI